MPVCALACITIFKSTRCLKVASFWTSMPVANQQLPRTIIKETNCVCVAILSDNRSFKGPEHHNICGNSARMQGTAGVTKMSSNLSASSAEKILSGCGMSLVLNCTFRKVEVNNVKKH